MAPLYTKRSGYAKTWILIHSIPVFLRHFVMIFLFVAASFFNSG